MSPAHCCQELHGSPGLSPGTQGSSPQGTGMLFGKRPWYQDTPFGSRNPSALPSWCCSHAEPRCPGVSVTASPSTMAGLGWARVGRESPEEQEGTKGKTRGTEIPVWRPTARLPLALSWAADGHTRFGRRSRGACTTLLTRAHLPVGVLQAKAQQCWLPRRAELSWKSKYGAPGPPTPAPRAGRGSCAVGHRQHHPQILPPAPQPMGSCWLGLPLCKGKQLRDAGWRDWGVWEGGKHTFRPGVAEGRAAQPSLRLRC